MKLWSHERVRTQQKIVEELDPGDAAQRQACAMQVDPIAMWEQILEKA
jgi:hypothetical protein